MLAFSVMALGCGSSEGNHDIPAPPQLVDGKFIMNNESSDGDVAKQPAFDWSKPIQFDPPNKGRTNPFVAKSDTGSASPTEQASEKASDDKFRIKGFVNVNGMRVFVRLGDDFRSLKEGESMNNIEIVKISPPQVTILRNGATETRSILDEPTDNDQGVGGGGPSFGNGNGDHNGDGDGAGWGDESQDPPELSG